MHIKNFKYYVLMAVAVCAACILGACSSDEPDEVFVADLLDDKSSAVINIMWDAHIYEKNEAGEWIGTSYDGIGTGILPCIINKGIAYAKFVDMRCEFDDMILSIWELCASETHYDKEIYAPSKFELNMNDNTIIMTTKVGETKLDILSTDGNQLYVENYGVTLNSDGTINMNSKKCFTLILSPLQKSTKKKIDFYSSIKEAKLAIVRKMRNHFGDTFYYGETFRYKSTTGDEFWLDWKVDLRRLENDIRNGSDSSRTFYDYLI